MATNISVSPAVKDLTITKPVVEDLTYVEPVVKKRERAKIEDIAYGESVYWLTFLSCFVVIIGSVISFVTNFNFTSTSYWISSVWQGLTVEQIWNGAGSSVPHGHWYLSYLTTGDGMQAFGLAIAFFSLIIGLVAASIVLFKKRSVVFGIFALIAAAVVAGSTFG